MGFRPGSQLKALKVTAPETENLGQRPEAAAHPQMDRGAVAVERKDKQKGHLEREENLASENQQKC